MPQHNQLKSNQFKLNIDYIPNAIYHAQSCILPSIEIDKPIQNTPHFDLPLGGTKLEFSPLTFNFIVDRDLSNYIEIYEWLINIATTNKNDDHFSTANLHLLKGNLTGNKIIQFNDLHPTSLSELSFDSKSTDSEIVECSVNFAYSYFEFV